jgi:26S proteasome regulatory subunit N6
LLAELCKESIEWCRAEKRAFLRQRIESRLAKLHLQMREYKEAISLVTRLAKEVKKVDDKLLLVEIHLTESRVHLALKNVPKSKGALTAARSAASAIYCPPLLQAEIDLQAGTLCAEERDFKTAFSYFFEAFEGYNTVNRPDDAVRCLKYMLLSKIMTDSPSEVYAIINSKSGVRHAGVEVESMRAIADAHKKRSLEAYEEVLAKFRPQLLDDPLVRAHLEELQDTLLEQNILRVVEPFSRVEIEHVARIMRLPQAQVEAKLSQLILDHKLRGILDQGAGLLILFGQSSADSTYETGLETIKELSNVVDKLYAKAKKLH